MRRIKPLIFVFLIVTFGVSIIINEVAIWDVIILLLSLIATFFVVNQYWHKRNLAKLLCLLIIYISVIILPSYNLVVGKEQLVSNIDYQHLISFGAKVFSVSVLSFIVTANLFPSHTIKMQLIYWPKRISHLSVTFFFIFLFFLTAYCYAIGLGRMGREAVVLPFHLGGIINLFRGVLAPFLFAIIVENYIIRDEKVPKWFYGVFIVWVLFEVFAWMSKGRLLHDLFPVALVLFLRYKPSFKTSIRYVTPLLFAFIFMYPIIAVMRSAENPSGSLIDNISNSRKEIESEDDGVKGGALLTPLNRTFMTSAKYVQDYDYIDQNSLFDFSKAPAIFIAGGAPSYQTFVIDGYPPTAVHSSGTTGFIDPLLHGGYGLCYIMIFLIMLFAAFIDRHSYKHQYVIYIQLLIMMALFITSSNISSFYDGVGVQTLVTRLTAIYFAYVLCYKRRIVHSR